MKFDGFKDGVLVDAKSGVLNFVNGNSKTFKSFFTGKENIIKQSRRQRTAAGDLPINWHFEHKSVRDAFENLLKNRGFDIKFIHTPKQMLQLITEINVMWKYREQTLRQSTETFIIFLERLKLFDSRFEIWYEGANSRKEGLKNKAKFEYDYMKSRFCKKCKDDDYPEFSFDIGFWNGGLTDSVSYGIRASLGGDGKIGNNICTLTFPYQGGLYEHYLIKNNWESLLELFIDHWQPDQYRDYDDRLIGI